MDAASWRLLRLCLHILRVDFAATSYRRESRGGQLMMIRDWSWHLLEILNVELRIGADSVAPVAPSVTVANHMSWLDAFVINAIQPARFVAKAEIRGWPFIVPCAK